MEHGGMVERIGTILPEGLRTGLGYHYKKYMFHRYLQKVFGDRYQPHSPGPMPPLELITTEALMQKDDLNIRAKPEWYFGSGCREAWTVLTMLQQCSCDLRSMRFVLEFGCGSARVLRHFRSIAGLQLAGTDANPKAIAWDDNSLRGIDFYQNELTPPLPFDDGTFDLIYALSVFTHIPLKWQRPWLDELRRVLVPGGYLLCTVHGDTYVRFQLNQEDRLQFERDGALMLDSRHPRASYSSQLLGSWDVFQARDQVRAVFGVGFEIRRYTTEPAAAGQDTLVLQKMSRVG
jgi:SAM-dependent methyltransferase